MSSSTPEERPKADGPERPRLGESVTPGPDMSLGARADLHPDLAAVLGSAAKLQQLVPDAILVGGSAAALYAGHRASYDHDHVLTALQENFDAVLEAVESEEGWATNRLAYGKIILGELGGIETGLRQLIRRRPLEVVEVTLPTGETIRVPTQDEALRIKAFLITKRNQTRDYLDVAALADSAGIPHASDVLSSMDDYYADQNADGNAVSSQVIRQLADPQPKDSRTTRQLSTYKGLASKWHDWSATVNICRELAARMVRGKD